MTTKGFIEYTREEMLECLTECYSALVQIYHICKYEFTDNEMKQLELIYEEVNKPLDKMFNRISSKKPATRSSLAQEPYFESAPDKNETH